MTKYISASEFAARYNIGAERVRQLCKTARIPGAHKVVVGGASVWLIPEDAEDPRMNVGRPRFKQKNDC